MIFHEKLFKEGSKMKTLTSRLPALFGTALLAAAMVFFFAACPQEPDPGKPEIPKNLQDTEWIHTSGDKISFDKDSVTIMPNGKQSQKFTLKGSQYVDEIKKTTLFFRDKKSVDDIITYQGGDITMVNFSIIDTLNRAKGWKKGSILHPDDLNILGSGIFGDFKYDYIATAIIITDYTGSGGTVSIPETIDGKPVVFISRGAFMSKQLTSVNIPNSVTSIGDWTFSGNALTSVTIPNSVTSIGAGAFSGNALTSVIIPNSITSIGDWAFSQNALTSVTIPNSITSIGDSAFSQNALTSVTIPNSVTSIGAGAFHRNQLTSITIPNSITSIEDYMFARNKLTSITILNNVTSIGDYAFYHNRLTNVTIPNSVTSIGASAFSSSSYEVIDLDDCNRLTSVTIGSNVTIGSKAFDDTQYFNSGFEDAYNITYSKQAGTYTRPNIINTTWTKQ